ncbi:MAG: FKBP-type peptidyl-prolyl cis-trans isomerase [Flavobacteriales bacterium]
MKKMIYLLPVLMIVASCGGKKEPKISLKTDKDKASYAIGVNQAERLMAEMQQGGIDSNAFDMNVFMAGMKDYFDKKPRLAKEEMQSVIMRYLDKLQEDQVTNFKKKNAGKKVEADKFLEAASKEPGVTKTPSGLIYQITEPGKGALIQLEDSVKIHYTGKYADGEIFDSSEGRAPYSFKLTAIGSVIPGWVEALQLMKKGAKAKLWVPYDLAYGEMGAAPRGPGDTGIPPYAVLVFDIHVADHDPVKK